MPVGCLTDLGLPTIVSVFPTIGAFVLVTQGAARYSYSYSHSHSHSHSGRFEYEYGYRFTEYEQHQEMWVNVADGPRLTSALVSNRSQAGFRRRVFPSRGL